MRSVPPAMKAAWLSGNYTGATKPIARVTVQRTAMTTQKINRAFRWGVYAFGNPNPQHELPNVKSVRWTRSTDQDAATCEISLYNVRPLPIGQPPNIMADGTYEGFEQLGYFTFNRGDRSDNRWNHTPTEWTRRLYPDMLIRTYEGYGFDGTVAPDADANLMPSGIWFIDDVLLDAKGTLTLRCRDAAALLLELLAFPPVIPTGAYPLTYEHIHTVPGPDLVTVTSGGWVHPRYSNDSGVPYVGANGSIGGHRPSDALDGSDSTYWLSIGNDSPNAPYSYEFVEGTVAGGSTVVSAFKVHVRGGPYRMYVSVYANGNWQGQSVIPYDPTNPVSAPNGANIKYVKSVLVDADDTVTVKLPSTYSMTNVTKVRVTFHGLWDSQYGVYPYRAAVRDFQVLVGVMTTTPTTKTVGNYSDYTDIVKQLWCYAGGWWPDDSNLGFYLRGDGTKRTIPAPSNDTAILKGLAWGDFEQSMTYGPTDLTIDIFDKKPLADGVTYIRDMLGFISYIDETGGLIFRSPNIWSLGNVQVDPDHRFTTAAGRVDPTTNPDGSWCVTIDEKQTLMALQATLSSRNRRERVIVANVGGNFGAVTKGFNPYNLPRTGWRRVAIWSDMHFSSTKECQIMADLVALRQMFTYRKDTVTIAGYPAIQIDDQVKIVERVTEESADDVHYVQSIDSSLDMESGEWTYQLGTQWLGKDPFGTWVFDPANLSSDTQTYLAALGKI